jgi:hypothetical protein
MWYEFVNQGTCVYFVFVFVFVFARFHIQEQFANTKTYTRVRGYCRANPRCPCSVAGGRIKALPNLPAPDGGAVM